MVEVKARKSAFLREAARRLNLDRTEVETARYEELLARPELLEAHDVLTLRAVRVETRVLLTLQAFVAPRGIVMLFRGPSGPEVPPDAGAPARMDVYGSTPRIVEKSADDSHEASCRTPCRCSTWNSRALSVPAIRLVSLISSSSLSFADFCTGGSAHRRLRGGAQSRCPQGGGSKARNRSSCPDANDVTHLPSSGRRGCVKPE